MRLHLKRSMHVVSLCLTQHSPLTLIHHGQYMTGRSARCSNFGWRQIAECGLVYVFPPVNTSQQVRNFINRTLRRESQEGHVKVEGIPMIAPPPTDVERKMGQSIKSLTTLHICLSVCLSVCFLSLCHSVFILMPMIM